MATRARFDVKIKDEGAGVYSVLGLAPAPAKGRPPADGLYLRVDADPSEIAQHLKGGQLIDGLNLFCISHLASKGFTCISIDYFAARKKA